MRYNVREGDVAAGVPTRIRWFRVIVIAVGVSFAIVAWAWFAAYRDAPETIDRILQPRLAEVRSITIRPSGYSSLLTRPVTITDRKTIRRFAEITGTAQLTRPNHPQSTWLCHISVEDSTGISHCTVSKTLSQGTLIYVRTRPTDGWLLGTYRCDDLAPFLEALVTGR